MSEIEYRTTLMDLADLKASMKSIEARLNTIRDMIIDDREDAVPYDTMLSYALHIEGVAASARKVLDLTDNTYP